MPDNIDQNTSVQLSPEMDERFRVVSSLTSLASFPSNITVFGQNHDERILLFIRKDKAVLIFNLVVQGISFLVPFLVQYLLYFLNNKFLLPLNNSINLDAFFTSKYWTAIILLWVAYVLRGFYNIFFKWYYDLNIMTTNRFLDLDLIDLFHNRLEETSISKIEDVKDTQTGIIQSLFGMGDLEIFTASGQTVFSLQDVPRSNKIRDFIMDIVIEERKKRPDAD